MLTDDELEALAADLTELLDDRAGEILAAEPRRADQTFRELTQAALSTRLEVAAALERLAKTMAKDVELRAREGGLTDLDVARARGTSRQAAWERGRRAA